MCQHAWEFDNATPTREERLMDAAAVRQHHADIVRRSYESEAGLEAYYAHRRLHQEAARRIRAEREK
jgi:hypothetical protein